MYGMELEFLFTIEIRVVCMQFFGSTEKFICFVHRFVKIRCSPDRNVCMLRVLYETIVCAHRPQPSKQTDGNKQKKTERFSYVSARLENHMECV